MEKEYLHKLFQALQLAADKHQYLRRGGYTYLPYINHLIKVTNGLIKEGKESDLDLLIAAILHDTIEDTDVDQSELERLFGAKVAGVVQELTDDMSLPYEERKQRQIESVTYLSTEAQKIRIADKASNLQDIFAYPLNWTRAKKEAYLKNSMEIVQQIRGKYPKLEKWFDAIVAASNVKLKEASSQFKEKHLSISFLIKTIKAIALACKAAADHSEKILKTIHPNHRESAINLLQYKVFRGFDLVQVQRELGKLGLSRLAKTQLHVMASLSTNLHILERMQEHKPIQLPIKEELSFNRGRALQQLNTVQLLGKGDGHRRTKIMVTMPSEAAENYELVEKMIQAGMDCARINCAHDGPDVWLKMIENIKAASQNNNRRCKIAMDLAGPKIRTGAMTTGPKVRKFRPQKDIYGQINQPLEIWIGPEPHPTLPHLPIGQEDLSKIQINQKLHLIDTRGKKRNLFVDRQEENGYYALCYKTTFVETGLRIFQDKSWQRPLFEIGEMPYRENAIPLYVGDVLRINKTSIPGRPAEFDESGDLQALAHISCTAPDVFKQVKEGEKMLFDDGKIEGIIEEVQEDYLLVKIMYAPNDGARLKADKGINLPDSDLSINGLTDKDKEDLKFVVKHADIINFSFVNRPEDVQQLLDVLDILEAKETLGIILKIETKNAFENLTDILLKAMQVYPIGVMIARGDLAIETGWYNIGRIQEEILSLCQAAHITDVWATQVLEGLAKKGLPSRAEITDAVMAQRADCVMLNKGPYIIETIRMLDTILTEMAPFWEKNAPFSPKMG